MTHTHLLTKFLSLAALSLLIVGPAGGNINAGLGELLDLRKVFKGEEEAVALLVY